MFKTATAAIVCSVIGLFTAACSSSVPIPPVSADHPPVITITSLVTGGSGVINEGGTPPGTKDSILIGTEFLVAAGAQNPGGVKSLSVTVAQGGTTIYTGSATGATDASGKVPDRLAVLESSDRKAMDVVMTTAAVDVTATATNFNHMTSTQTAVYTAYDLAPRITSFTATPTTPISGESPTLCYIYAGESCSLAWSTNDCNTLDCNVTLTALGGLDYDTTRDVMSHLPSSGSVTVSPATDTMTKYVLLAQNTAGSTSQSVVVQIYSAPPAGQYFYYKITQSSTVTPCFTVEVYAQTQSQADEIVHEEYAGDTITSITEKEYVAGC